MATYEDWSSPVSRWGFDKDNDHFAEVFRKWGSNQQWLTPGAECKIAVTHGPSSKPIYPLAGKTREQRVWPEPAFWGSPGLFDSVADKFKPTKQQFLWFTVEGPPVGLKIPMNPAWRTAAGTHDLAMLIDDDINNGPLGAGWELIGLREAPWWEYAALEFLTKGAFEPGDWIFGMCQRRDPAKPRGRGMGGSPKRWGITTAAEVASGEIGHALAVVGFNLGTGPQAPFRGPAERVEHPELKSKMLSYHPNWPDQRLIPQALHLAADPELLTDAEIDRRLKARKLSPEYEQTCRVFWRAMRIWGAIIGAETGTGSPTAETTGTVEPYPEAPHWKQLGLKTASHTTAIFDGFPYEWLRVVNAHNCST